MPEKRPFLQVELRNTLYNGFLLCFRQFRKHGESKHFAGGAF